MDEQTDIWTLKKLDKFSTKVQACHLIHTSQKSLFSNYCSVIWTHEKGLCVPCLQGRHRPWNAYTNEQTDRLTDGQMYRQTNRQTERRKTGQTDGQTDRLTNRRKDGQTDKQYGWTDGQMDRQMDGQTNGQIERQMDDRTSEHTDGQNNMWKDG